MWMTLNTSSSTICNLWFPAKVWRRHSTNTMYRTWPSKNFVSLPRNATCMLRWWFILARKPKTNDFRWHPFTAVPRRHRKLIQSWSCSQMGWKSGSRWRKIVSAANWANATCTLIGNPVGTVIHHRSPLQEVAHLRHQNLRSPKPAPQTPLIFGLLNLPKYMKKSWKW